MNKKRILLYCLIALFVKVRDQVFLFATLGFLPPRIVACILPMLFCKFLKEVKSFVDKFLDYRLLGGDSLKANYLRRRCDFYGFLLNILSCLVVPAWKLQASYIMSWPVESRGRPFFAMTRIATTSSPISGLWPVLGRFM